jgi:hypothetical protein
VSAKDSPVKDFTYFHERLDVLGWTPERGRFTTPNWESRGGVSSPIPEGQWDHKSYTYELFDVGADGNLVIPYYRLNGSPANYRKGDGPVRNYSITRLRTPMVNKEGDQVKYLLPKGAGTFPWFPPRLIEAYRKKTQLEALVLTEGALKAFAAANAGADVVGLTSITHAKDRDKSTESLHTDIVDLIRTCNPKKVIYLVDGDCKHFPRKWNPESEDEEERNVDLFIRPNQFFSSARTVRDLLQDLSNELGFSIWFKHVESGSVEVPKGDTPPKGLDDLLIAAASVAVKEAEARASIDVSGWAELDEDAQKKALTMVRVEAQQAAHGTIVKELIASSGPIHHFYRKSLDKLGDMKKYFHITNAQDFHAAYSERLGQHAFVFNGTKYQYDGKELVVVLPAVMRAYVRVGDTYYERVPIPNRFGVVEEKLHVRQKGTIRDDHGDMVKRIQKLKAFCNTPSHEDYQQIIQNCLNRYQPFEHVPEQGEFPHIQKFLKHIFGDGEVEAPHPKKRDKESGRPLLMKVNELELGYDYMQLLYKAPTQMLPILCLVSQKRETGKSTFAKLIKAMYTGNAAFVSSQDLQSDFNEHWITKLAVICEEAFIEKKATIERIKDLSTASVSMVNSKGVQQTEIEVFLKFILCSNNVRNFINTDGDEIRFWVRNVPPIPDGDKNPDLEKLMYDEIPAFLYFLSKRSMATERLSRMWFYPALLETDALRVVRENSQPVVKRQLEGWMKQMFLALQTDEIRMTADDIKREVFKGQNYDVDYIRRVIKEDIGAETVRNSKGTGPGTCTYSYHRMVERQDGVMGRVQEMEQINVKMPARPYVFRRELFFNALDWEMLQVDAVAAKALVMAQGGDDGDDADLPF